MKTISDLVKENTEEALRLDLYFYEKELNSDCVISNREKLLEKIQSTEQLLNNLRTSSL